MKEYDPIVLKKFSALIKKEEGAQEWLVENGYRELQEFWDAVLGIEKSFQWLKTNGFVHFAAMTDAIHGNAQARAWLIQHGYRILAAVSDAAEGNKIAVALLLKLRETDWLNVAKTMYDFFKKKEKKSIFNFGNPFS
jgi:hypothetical protein